MPSNSGREISPVYEFGPFRLDLRERRLLRGDTAVAVPVKLFDLLAVLVATPGTLRTRSELIEEVWPRTIVEEHSLTSRISTLRKVLGDEGETPVYIETVRGIGYRFITPVRVVEEDAGQAAAATRKRPRWLAWGAAAAAAAMISGVLIASLAPREPAAPTSIAVLPFANLGKDLSTNYFADGVQNTLLTRIAGLHGMRVVAKASTARYPNHADDIHAIGKELGVDAVLEGSVQRVDEKILITAQLLDTRSGRHLWAQSYTRPWANILDLENEVAAHIATALKARLGPQDLARLKEAPTSSPRAYDQFLRAEYAALKVEEGGDTSPARYEEAVAAYKAAIEDDPGFALAKARLSFLQSYAAWFGVDTRTGLKEEAERYAEEALTSDLPEAHLALGYARYWSRRDYDGALEQFRIAQAALPNNAAVRGSIAFIERRRGNWENALAGLEQAELLDPRNSLWFSERAHTFAQLGRYAESLTEYDRALSIDPGNVRIKVAEAMAFLYSGQLQDADALMSAIPAGGDTSGVVATARFRVAMWMRKSDSALAALDRPGDDWLEDVARSNAPAYLFRAQAWQLHGDATRARNDYQNAKNVLLAELPDHQENFNLWSALARASAGLGDATAAAEAAERALKLMPARRDAITGAATLATLAEAYAELGDARAAVELLRKLLDMSAGDFVSAASLANDPCWDRIRHDAAFREVSADYARVANGAERVATP